MKKLLQYEESLILVNLHIFNFSFIIHMHVLSLSLFPVITNFPAVYDFIITHCCCIIDTRNCTFRNVTSVKQK